MPETEQEILFNQYLTKEVFPQEGMCKHGNWECSICNYKKKILVALSGGVDSSVALALLKKQGYNLVGVFLRFWKPDNICSKKIKNSCCTHKAANTARLVCEKLKVPFYIFDVSKEFKKMVVDEFILEYEAGRTPNPCIVCNKFIKFGWLLDKVKKLGCDYIATGHYARLSREIRNSKSEILNNSIYFETNKFKIKNKNAKLYHLHQAKDKIKDQSYFLWQLDQKQLKHIIFPLGNYTKDEVRKMAKKLNLPTYNKKESQDICFIKGNIKDFLMKYSQKIQKIGNIVDVKGNILGEHNGLLYYTIGQREKLPRINYKNYYEKINPQCVPAIYVIKLDIRKNKLVVGLEKDLYQKKLIVKNINWINPKLVNFPFKTQAKIRYNTKKSNCLIKKNSKIEVMFDKPQRAITSGQSIVFYNNNELVGGGIIE